MTLKFEIIRELLSFLVDNLKWWLGTIIVLLLLLATLLALTEGSALAPFIYAIF